MVFYKTKVKQGLIFLFLSVLSCANAQNSYNLAQVVEIAVKNNLDLQKNQLNNKTAENNRRLAIEALYPNLNAGATQGFNAGRTVDPSTNQFIDQYFVSNNFSINSNLTVYNGFRLRNNIKQSNYALQASKYEVEDFKNTIILNTLNAYLQVIFNREILNTNQNQLKTSQSQLDRMQRMFDAGMVAENNLIDIKSRVATDELGVVNAENQYLIAKFNLVQLMNLPLESIRLDSLVFEYPPMLENIEVSDNASEVFSVAEKTQPVIRGAELRLLSSEYNYRALKGNLYPRLTLSAQIFTLFSSQRTKFSRLSDPVVVQTNAFVTGNPSQTISTVSQTPIFGDYPFVPQLRDNVSQSLTFNLAIPIYNNSTARVNLSNAQINKKNADLNLVIAKQQLRKRIEQAVVDVKAAKKRKEALEAQVIATELAFKLLEKRFNSGVANFVDYNVANNSYLKAQSDLIQATFDLILKSKLIDFYKNNEITY